MSRSLRFALFGAGFWAQYQLAAWLDLPGVECVAIYNRTRHKAETLAARFGVPAVYDDPEALLGGEQVDFIDLVTAVEAHAPLVHLTLGHGIPVICQKPMATSLTEAEGMVRASRLAGVPFFVHENWRWQYPIRKFKERLQQAHIGQPFRAHVQYCNSFPVFENQPFLKELRRFMLTDMGSHILDIARCLFGEVSGLYCQTQRVHSDISGEDVATVMLRMGGGMSVVCELSCASRLERERFPETFILVEGERGSLELAPDYWVRETTEQGTWAKRFPPPRYPWADPAYGLVHASIRACNENLLGALQGRWPAETTGEDNLRTVRLVFAAYNSAGTDRVVRTD